ncbi:MAG: DUF4097 family beta strand repeat-containing protein [Acidobacteriota bacterium]
MAFAIFAFAPFSVFFAQTPSKQPEVPVKRKVWKNANRIKNESETPAEKSITVSANVNISLCVEGNLKVNGWERNEVRAFVSDGSQVGFAIIEKGKQNDGPIWIKILGFDPAVNKENNPDECLSGDTIEIDVPRGASVNVKSNTSEMRFDSVAKVTVENGGGDIFFNNIARGIEARTYEGDVTVEGSSGAMSLQSTTGNIIAFDVSSGEIGDIFKAKTSNGAITLKNVGQRQIEAGSNTGSINFNGKFLSGGQYSFGTSNGSINLSIPPDSSLKMFASYGYGSFNSEVALQNVERNAPSRLQNLSAQMGDGNATLKLTTVNGAIRIKKQ